MGEIPICRGTKPSWRGLKSKRVWVLVRARPSEGISCIAIVTWLGSFQASQKANTIRLRRTAGRWWKMKNCRLLKPPLFGDQFVIANSQPVDMFSVDTVWYRTCCLCTGKWSHQKSVVYFSILLYGSSMFWYPTFLTCLKGCSMIQ